MNYIQLSLFLWLFTFLLVKNYYVFMIVIATSFIIYYIHKKRYRDLLPILFILCSITCSYILKQNQNPFIEKGIVVELKTSSIIVKDIYSSKKYVLYTDEEIGLGSIIEWEGERREISALRNKGIFNYELYCRNNHILSSYSNVTIVKKRENPFFYLQSKYIYSSSLRKAFLADNHEYNHVIFSSGMQFSFLFSLFGTVLNFFVYESKKKKIIPIITIICFLIYPFEFALYRMALLSLFRLRKYNKKKQIFFFLTISLVLQPYDAYSLRFVLPLLFYLSNIYLKHIPYIVRLCFILFPTYIIVNHEISLCTLLLFPIIKNIYGLFFISSFFPFVEDVMFALFNFYETIIDWIYQYDIKIAIGNLPILLAIFYFIYGLSHASTKQLASLIICLVLYLPLSSIRLITHVTFIDVGQGDSILIEFPFASGTILVDTGGNKYKDIAQDVLIPILKSRGIRSLDYVFLSHEDYDHSGAFDSLNENYSIKNIVTSINEPSLYSINNSHSIQAYQYSGEDNNDSSLILRVNIHDFHVFLGGDISSKIEEKIMREKIPMQSTIMKLSHHGSSSSNNKRFIGYIQPQYAINSSGKNNRYQHPSTRVIATLEELRVPYFDTQKEGMIECLFFKHFIVLISKERGICGIIKQ